MSRKVLLFFVWLAILTMQTHGQEYGVLPDFTPQPPNTTSFFKAMEKPTGTFTGIPPISIPIHTCHANGLSLPIALNYNAGGIKVEEMASSCGLGWGLSAGGMITRIVNGLPDELFDVGYLTNYYKPSDFDGSYDHLYNVLNGLYDLEPDIYVFSFNGYSGKFTCNEAGDVIMIDNPDNLKVEGFYNTYATIYGSFKITDAQGYSYHFGDANGTNYDLTNFYYFGWHLSSIYDMNGQQIASLEYDQAQTYYKTRTSVSHITRWFGDGSNAGCTSNDFLDYAIYDSERQTGMFEAHLKKITMGGDIVLFTNNTGRIDVSTSLRLDSIRVFDANNVVRKKFRFNYDYFTTPNYFYFPTSPAEAYNHRFKRLKLKNVAQFAIGSSDSLKHDFQYEESVDLPDRLSKSVDYWGFANGAWGNYTIVPNGIYTNGGSSIVTIYGMGERRSNPAHSIAYSLKKISYPTGGYRQFEFEGNEILYSYYNDNLLPDPEDHVQQTFDTTEFDNYDPLYSPSYTRNFTVNSAYGGVNFNFELLGWGDIFNIKIYRTDTPPYEPLAAEFNEETSGTVGLKNGTYRLEFYFDYYASFSSLYVYWDEVSITSGARRNAGGLRIRSIDDYDPLTDKHHVTKYKYYFPSDTTITSGTLTAFPHLVYRNSCEEKNCYLARISAQSGYPLNPHGGSYVVYPHVRVIDEGNGYTDMRFGMQMDEPQGFGWDFPLLPYRDMSFARGQLLTEHHYKEGGTLLRCDSTVYYPYDFWWSYAIPVSNGIKLVVHDLYDTPPLYCTNTYGNVKNLPPHPKENYNISYSPGGTNTVKTFYAYHHPEPEKNIINKVSTLRSNGDSSIAVYRYAFNNTSDFKLGLSGAGQLMKDSLLELHYLEPLEIVHYVKKGNDTSFAGGIKNSFASFGVNNKHLTTVKNFTTLSDSAAIHFSRHAGWKKINEQYKENDAKEVYLWGYGGSYVVARVTGSDYNTVAALVNNSVLQNPSSDAALRTELNNIRTGLAGSQAQVTTYTYLPAVGISSITDAAGRTTYYRYDKFNRLSEVRDQDNNVLKKIEYSYQQ